MDLIKKSVGVIKDLQLSNGGILATPLDGAYPYVYIRDGVIMTKALNRVGFVKNSEKVYYFVDEFAKPDNYKDIFHRYNKEGLPYVTRKHQHDNVGLVLHGIYDAYLHNKDEDFLENMWSLINKCCNLIFSFSDKGLVYTETSLHELYRLEKGYELWANCACTRGLYDASKIAEILKHKKQSVKWEKRAKKIHQNIKSKLFNKKTKLFMKNLRHPAVSDISQLAPFYFNLIDSRQILRRTVKHIQTNLWYKEAGGFRRFKKFEICKDWHWYTGGSGGWIAFTAWMMRFYRELRDRKNYNLCQKWLEKIALRANGLFPEHIATKQEYDTWKMNEIEFNNRILKGMGKSEKLNKKFKKKFKEDVIYWGIPLGWAHAEYILLHKEGKNEI